MYRYEQHCPIARAAEVLTESWTLLVVRELSLGHDTRAAIAAGVPAMSATLLGRRLSTLVANGLVDETREGGETRYRLTAAGRDLRPIVDQLGRWGQRWLAPPGLADLDAAVLLRDICAQMTDRLPTRALSVEVVITDAPAGRQWWLALSPDGATVGAGEPRVTPDVRLLCTLSGLAGAWLGQQSWLAAVRARSVVLVGSPAAARVVLACIGVHRYAGDQRVPA